MTALQADTRLRPIGHSDADGFAALVRRVFLRLDADPQPSAARLTGDDVRVHLAGGGGGLVAQSGSAGLLWAGKDGGLYVSRVVVDPDCQRQGLATMLLNAAEAEAVRLGLPRIWLSTRLAFAGNRRLFGRLGFVETVLHSHPGYVEPTFVDMVKALGPARPGRPDRDGTAQERTVPSGV